MEHRTGLGGASQQQDDPFTYLEIPSVLLPSLNRHRETLARFVLSLKSMGLNEAQIASNVSEMVASYKDELLCAIQTIKREP